ncbi:MAG: ATP-dependent helicase [Mailhella sp.]|nr:ATP-dependent helicase [Mailhella sp.]
MLDISSLNQAQRAAVTAEKGPILVIAGAGSGKTRTIVYRLAWLAQRVEGARSMLLLTFTRKASQEMKQRAASLLGAADLAGTGFLVQGGTFHSYAYSVLRRHAPEWAGGPLGIMDAADGTAALQACKENLGIGRGDRSFPHTPTVLALLSKSRNKEQPIKELLACEAQHLLPHAGDLENLAEAYRTYKREHLLLDYDDLLFELERLFLDQPDFLEKERSFFSQIMVDEYQDTNLVQARIVRLLAGDAGNVMVVGDDAQSIYAFRGATVRNILDFPKSFPGTRIIRLEENYRSVQPVLDVANVLLENSGEGYSKRLFSHRPVSAAPAVALYRPISDLTQAQLAAKRIEELLENVPADDIAVLFRSGYQSYHLELELNKRGVGFKKYGGLRYAEAAHIKDVMAFVRLAVNPLDLLSFERIAALSKGIGPKTARKLFSVAVSGSEEALKKACRRWPDFLEHLSLVSELRSLRMAPEQALVCIKEIYQPMMESLFPDDWPRRVQGLEALSNIASSYDDLQAFVSELSLDQPEESQEDDESCITLSTVHSAKGLEWSAVLILDLVEDRFPSRHALVRPEEFEEERRLMYVACTRAKDTLDLFSPLSVYSKMAGGLEPASPSPFVRELPSFLFEEVFEGYGGSVRRSFLPERHFVPGQETESHSMEHERSRIGGTGRCEVLQKSDAQTLGETLRGERSPSDPKKLGYCTHKLFGRGKIVEEIPPDRYRVNFPGMGLKIIMAEYLTMEN